MFQTGDRVVYGIHGVCEVTDFEEKNIDKKPVTYLVLEPVVKDGSRYMIPAHNPSAMSKLHRVLSSDELMEMLQSDAVHSNHWIHDETQRKQTYRELIGSGDREKLMGMIHSIYVHKCTQAASGRKCHLSDENFLKDAEKLLIGEISIVMEIDYIAAKQLIKKYLA